LKLWPGENQQLQFLKELQRRNVFRVAIAYIVTAWLVMQVADVILNNISAPDWIFKVLLLFLSLGFPFAVIFAWAFELTPEGLRRETAPEEGGSSVARHRNRFDILILAAMVIALAYFAWSQYWQAESDSVAPGQIRSIAVLPLENLMNDPGQSYFVDGMHEALITELSKIKSLRVISRTSAMHFKDSGKPIPEIALELGVDAIIEGSVLKAGNVVRVTTQLIEGKTDQHIWADNFDRELNDILALYADVTREIVDHIKVNVTPDEVASLAISEPVNPEVYELYLKGRYLCGNWSPQEMQQGVDLLQQAIDLDPRHAPSHAQLALCLQDSAFFEYVKPLEIESRARAAAMTAVQLDSESAESHIALGGVSYYLGFDPKNAEVEYFRARELNPNSTDALLRISWFLAESGRFEEALGPTQHAIDLDPLSTSVRNALGQVYHLNRDYHRAIQEFEKALDLDRSDPSLHYYLAGPYEQLGQHQRAISLYKSAIDLSESAPLYVAALGHAYAVAGKQDEAMQILGELQESQDPSAYNLAVVHLGLGQHEQAIDWLEKAFEARNGHVLYIKEGPRFDPLRTNQRFIDLLEQFGW
jgi:TolB-like protein/Tfp pilus assembly protein PilF